MRASRLSGVLLWGALGFSAAMLPACDDTTEGSGPSASRGDARAPSQGVDPDAAPPALGDAELPADQGIVAPPDGAAPVDAAPRPECSDDEACGPGRVCHDDRCIEGTRCEADRGCPAGRICVADICLADPRSTGGLIAEPDVLVFSFSEAGETSIRGARAENRGDDTVVITAIDAAPAAFQVLDAPALPLRLVPGQGVDITVQYTADDAVDDEGALSLRTDRAAAEPVQVRLTSQHKVVGGQDPCLQVAPNRLDFGGVTRGDTATRTFELVSCGEVPVRINAIRRGVSFFGALPDTYQLQQPPAFPLELAPGQRHTITVAYSPRRAGIEGGFWDVHSTDPTNPQQRVDVSALATPPPLEQVGLHVRLAWDTDLTDVDLHLVGPGGQLWTCAGDCYFSNPNPNWSDPMDFRDDPFLDVDDVDGFGPENINLEAPAAGTYRVVVQYWADHAGDVPDATVELLEFGNVIASYGPVRMSRVDDVWEVVDIQYPGPVLTPLGANAINQGRGALCGGFERRRRPVTAPHRFTLSPAGGLGVFRALLLLGLCGWGQYAAWRWHRDADPAQIALVAGGILLATVMMGVAWGRLRRGGRRFTLEVRDGAATLRRADGTFPPPTDRARLHLQAGRWTLRSDTGSAVIGPALTMRGDGWPKVVIGCAGGKPAWAGNVRSVSAPTHTVPASQWPTLLAALHLDPAAPPR